MKQFAFIAAVWLLSSCGGAANKSNVSTADSTSALNKVGADKDEQGCRGSAGYVWSAVKDSCIRPFESGTEFTSYGSNSDSTQAAYIVLSNDKRKAEVFFALTDKPIVMDAVAEIEGDIAPILFENKTEMVDVISRKDAYYIRFKSEPRFIQQADVQNGLSSQLKR
jgi:hypothetical protein